MIRAHNLGFLRMLTQPILKWSRVKCSIIMCYNNVLQSCMSIEYNLYNVIDNNRCVYSLDLV